MDQADLPLENKPGVSVRAGSEPEPSDAAEDSLLVLGVPTDLVVEISKVEDDLWSRIQALKQGVDSYENRQRLQHSYAELAQLYVQLGADKAAARLLKNALEKGESEELLRALAGLEARRCATRRCATDEITPK
jgi:hypothetical protein